MMEVFWTIAGTFAGGLAGGVVAPPIAETRINTDKDGASFSSTYKGYPS